MLRQRSWVTSCVVDGCERFKVLRACTLAAMVCVSKVVLQAALVACRAEASPLFPSGADAALSDLAARVKPLENSQSDVHAVDTLKHRGVEALAGAIAQDARDDQMASYAQSLVHAKLSKLLYAGGCPRDTSGCPSGWAERAGSCEPPADYDGFCAAVDVGTLQKVDKEAFAWKCRAAWPCVPACARDFSTCPDQWSSAGGLCVAPDAYDGMCSPAMNFDLFTDAGKAEWAAACDASWPCAAY